MTDQQIEKLLEEIKTAAGKSQRDVFYYIKADQALAIFRKPTCQPRISDIAIPCPACKGTGFTQNKESKMAEQKEKKPYCCVLGCGNDAEWEIYAEGTEATMACTDHVGELLTDAKEHHIYRLDCQPKPEEPRENDG